MPIFNIENGRLSAVELKNFALEKDLQNLIEKNLETVFNCKFVASEFSTGVQHAGRIDTLALSEENNPVIIEYKKVESSELINQSLFYLHWIQDHKGDFEIAVQKQLGRDVKVDWTDIRVICIAPDYKKYDLHAVQVMGANIELWKYHLFSNNSLLLEKIIHNASVSRSYSNSASIALSSKNPIMVEAGKKAAVTRATSTYTFEQRLQGKSHEIIDLTERVREFVLSLDDSIEEIPKKYYVAYKLSQNIMCMEVNHRQIKIFLKLKPSEITQNVVNYRDVSSIGHYGTGDVEFTLSNQADFEPVKDYIRLAYNKQGG